MELQAVDENQVKDEGPSKMTAVPEPELKRERRLPMEVEKWSPNWCEATAASDMTNHILSPILRLLTESGLPPYYRLKAFILCSAAYRENESPRDLESYKYFLEKAKLASQRCEVYTHPDDCKEVQEVKDYLGDEWQRMLKIEATANEECPDSQEDRHVDSDTKQGVN